jgi:hypothetical protein
VTDFWEIENIMDKFKQVSGLELAPNKSEVMWIGPWKNNPPNNSPFTAVKEMKLLGKWFTTNIEEARHLNYNPIIEYTKKKTSELRARGVSLLGRVELIKSLIYSKIQYTAAIISPNEKQIKSLNKLIYNYLWKGVDQIPREKAALPVDKGGIGLEQPKDRIFASMAINWIKWRTGTNSIWCQIIQNRIKRMMGWNILSMNINRKVWKEVIGNRIGSLLDAWFHFGEHKFPVLLPEPESVNFHGIKIKLGDTWCTTSIYPSLLNAGITQIGELFDRNGKKFELETIGITDKVFKKEYKQVTNTLGKIIHKLNLTADWTSGQSEQSSWPKRNRAKDLKLRTPEEGLIKVLGIKATLKITKKPHHRPRYIII